MNAEISKAAVGQVKPPRRVVLGKKSHGRLSDDDIITEFLVAFCHVAMERCSASISEWPIDRFGPVYEHKKCPDVDFRSHVAESCGLAKQYLDQRRLYAFEVSMVTAADVQLISFRIVLSQFDDVPKSERVDNIYARFSEILESVRNLEVTESTDITMCSTKYRPRIRLLTRLRPESTRKIDTSKVADPDSEIAVPIGDSVCFASNLFSFYAHMQ